MIKKFAICNTCTRRKCKYTPEYVDEQYGIGKCHYFVPLNLKWSMEEVLNDSQIELLRRFKEGLP
jgi:hypothetical protein